MLKLDNIWRFLDNFFDRFLSCNLSINHLYGLHFKRVQSIETWRQNTCLARSEHIVPILIQFYYTYIIKFVSAFVLQMLCKLVYFVFYTLNGLRITDVVGFDIRLSQKRVVNLKLWVKS